jgi:hypothetical protein
MSDIVLWLCVGGTVCGACGQTPSRAPEALRSTDNDSAQTLAAGQAETSKEMSTTVGRADNPQFPIRKDWKWGYMNRDGKVVIEPRYDNTEPVYEGLAAVKLGEKWGYVDQRAGLRAREVGLHRQEGKTGHRAELLVGRFVFGRSCLGGIGERWQAKLH